MSIEDLTPRQQEIARLMAQGLKNVQIAQRLGISDKNVSVQKTHMKHRLGGASHEQIVAMVKPAEPATLPPEIDVRDDDYVSPRLRAVMDAAAVTTTRKRTLFFHVTRGPARTMP